MMTLQEAQQTVDRWIKTAGNGYFQPVTNVAILAEEVGELAHVVVRRYGEQKPKPGDATEDNAIAAELADILWVTLALANQMNIDLAEAFEQTHSKRIKRDANRY